MNALLSCALGPAMDRNCRRHCISHPFTSKLIFAGMVFRIAAELPGDRVLQTIVHWSDPAPKHLALAMVGVAIQ